MYPFLFGISIIQQFRPYFRKHISKQLDPHEYLFLNTLIIAAIIIIYLVYLWSKEQHSFTEMFGKYSKLTFFEYCCIIILSLITVCSSIFIFYFDKYYNNPFINSIFLKAFGMVSLLVVSVFFFKEKYNWQQVIGIITVLFGLYLMSLK
jgi:drug/metabolite transporter (DMT)-like permease